MTNSLQALRVGTRNSRLALIQTQQAASYFRELIPFCQFEIAEYSSPGDRDQLMDLRSSPPDFFTKDLDDAIINRHIDAAIHSAKDMPEQVRPELDWCWLPIKEDPRDAIVLPKGKTIEDVPAEPRIGISSDRRESWCQTAFPSAKLLPIRGTIEMRIQQLDRGYYDVIIMAGAALIRLGLINRISKWIESDRLQVPDGQGILALTFRYRDMFWTQLRKLFVKPVLFAGAGCGRGDTVTIETVKALQHAQVCIYDALFDKSLLDYLPADAVGIDAGKRLGNHKIVQSEINLLIAQYARRGLQVVRLKGGDPGIFGRLAEETESLDSLQLPYKVYPGISSLQCATTGTGMLLTRRGLSRGFCVMTPRSEGGDIADINNTARLSLPQIYFMGLSSAKQLCDQLIKDGNSGDTQAAVVFKAGSLDESIIRGTLLSLPDLIKSNDTGAPGIIIIGSVTKFTFNNNGALGGIRVLVTCSSALQSTAQRAISSFGGVPIPFPAIKITPCLDGLKDLVNGKHFDWLVLTSPSAVHSTISVLSKNNLDIRILPPVIVSGPGTAKALEQYNLKAAVIPDKDFGADGILQVAGSIFKKGQTILRLRSDVAGEELSEKLRDTGCTVTDRIICKNVPVHNDTVPEFDAVLFASSSAVKSLLEREHPLHIAEKAVLAIGKPTARALKEKGFENIISAPEAMIEKLVDSFAIEKIRESVKKIYIKGSN